MSNRQEKLMQAVSALTNVPTDQLISIVEVLNLVQLQNFIDGHEDIVIPGIGLLKIKKDDEGKLNYSISINHEFDYVATHLTNVRGETIESIMQKKLEVIDVALINQLLDTVLTKEDLLDLGIDVI